MSLILVIEDNPDNLALLEIILESNNYDVHLESDGQAGVTAAIDILPDLILMDINMPLVDGYAALELLRADEKTRDIPVVAVTGNATPGDRERIVTAQFDRIVVKPYGVDEILSVVAEMLGGRT